jgi:hypothetical protein
MPGMTFETVAVSCLKKWCPGHPPDADRGLLGDNSNIWDGEVDVLYIGTF